MSETHNPYSAPGTNVVTKQVNHNSGFIKQFKRFTTWGVIGLAIITLGVYLYYWMINRTKILNGLLPENRIPMWLPYTAIGLGILNLILVFYLLQHQRLPQHLP